MIKLFRNIRKNLLAEGKTTKYLKYAIGEIVLVVIGILIALQVNNWNENRKTHQKQIIFLNNVKQDLTNDLFQLNEIITYQTKKLNRVNELKDALISEKKDVQKIESLFTIIQNTGNNTFFANTGAYTTSGTSDILENIEPETLKIGITTLYERYYKRLIYNGEVYDARNDEVAVARGKYYIKLTSKLVNEAVINDSEFLNLTSIILYNNANYVSLCNTTKIEIENILALIDHHLNP